MQKNIGVGLILALVVVIVGLIIATQSSSSVQGSSVSNPITNFFSPCDAEQQKLDQMNTEYLNKLKKAKMAWLEQESSMYQMFRLVQDESDASADEMRKAILDATTCKPNELNRCNQGATEELIAHLASEIPQSIWNQIESILRDVVTNGMVEFQEKCLSIHEMDQNVGYSYLDGPTQDDERQRCKRLTTLRANIVQQHKKMKKAGCKN